MAYTRNLKKVTQVVYVQNVMMILLLLLLLLRSTHALIGPYITTRVYYNIITSLNEMTVP